MVLTVFLPHCPEICLEFCSNKYKATYFIYPAITVLLAWKLLQQRPSIYQLALMGVILGGVFLLNWIPPSTGEIPGTSGTALGFLCALCASFGFGLYGIFSEIALPLSPPTARKKKSYEQILPKPSKNLVTISQSRNIP